MQVYLPSSSTGSSSAISPELAVAFGAALAGKRLADLRHGRDPAAGSFLMDITPTSLGVKVYANENGTDFQVLIKRNVLYPVEEYAGAVATHNN